MARLNEELARFWSFSRALDLAMVDEEIEKSFQIAVGKRHGERVAYIALNLGRVLGLSQDSLIRLTAAGLLHDIGAVGGFRSYHGDHRLVIEHCLIGARIVEDFPWADVLVPVAKYHHEAPEPRRGALGIDPNEVPLMARIVSLADKVDVHLARQTPPKAERDKLLAWLEHEKGQLFFPEIVAAFQTVARREAFWLDLGQEDLREITLAGLAREQAASGLGVLCPAFTRRLAEIFAGLIDQKSEFTARHSSYVAATVSSLAGGLGWSEAELEQIRIAAYLHDLGKLAVPSKILDKPDSLTAEEFEAIRCHTYYTHHLLTDAGFPDRVVRWAAYHHERLDGQGYPFALEAADLDTGCRLMTIADIWAALTEERPYRQAMAPAAALQVLERGAGTIVDPDLAKLARRILL